jgi:hypothetical protein
LVWDDRDVQVDFTLTDPKGDPVAPSATREGRRYQVATVDGPTPGDWTLRLTTAGAEGAGASEPVAYSLMTLESNEHLHARFGVRGSFHTRAPLLVVADLSKNREPLVTAEVLVEVKHPAQALAEFMPSMRLGAKAEAPRVERTVVPGWRDEAAAVMAKQGIERATRTETIRLEDSGQNGDAIPGDGRYSGYFTDTAVPGIYRFRFIADSATKAKGAPALHLEQLISVQVTPRVLPLPELAPTVGPATPQ